MQYCYKNLYQTIINNGESVKTIADVIGTSEDKLCKKLQGISPWYLSEAMLICQHFNTTDIKYLFSN